MIPLVSAAEMAEIDRHAHALGIPELVLMEDAANALARELLKELAPRTARVVCVAGSGNNGGDVLAIARLLHTRGVDVAAVLLKEPPAGRPTSIHAAILVEMGISVVVYATDRPAAERAVAAATYIVDGLLGTGFIGPIRTGAAALVARMNSAEARRISVDVPSGLGEGWEEAATVVDADLTLTVELPKLCCYSPAARPRCGRIRVVPVGFPQRVLPQQPRRRLLQPDDLGSLVGRLAPEGYKGTRGHVAVFAGAIGTAGAGKLCASAAQYAGAGLVSLVVDDALYPSLAGVMDSVMVRPLSGFSPLSPSSPGVAGGGDAPAGPPSTGGTFATLPPGESGPAGDPPQESRPLLGQPDGNGARPARFDAVVVGPGWGRSMERRELFSKLVTMGVPTVVDADAIGLLEAGDRPAVITPHPGEASALWRRIMGDSPATDRSGGTSAGSSSTGTSAGCTTDEFDRLWRTASSGVAQRLAKALGCVVVLKCTPVVVADPEGQVAVWDRADASLAVGGAGDVLAGVVGALIAGGTPPFEAAQAAVIAHAQAGAVASQRYGFYDAADQARHIGATLHGVRTAPPRTTEYGDGR